MLKFRAARPLTALILTLTAGAPALAAPSHGGILPADGDAPVHLSAWVYDAIKLRHGRSGELDWSRPDAPDLRGIEAALAARPSLSGPEQLLEGDEFVLHYTTEGADGITEEQAQAAFTSIGLVWNRELRVLGYPTPPGDGVRGGDDRYDFYFTQQRLTYGVTYGETLVDSNSMTSYIALGSWMNEAEIQVTVAHEFFHAIHYAMDAFEETWWFEVTATWMEDIIYDDINDYYNYIPDTMEAPGDSLRDTANMYANAIYAHSLSERFGVDVIKAIWEDASQADAPGALASNRAVVERQRADWEEVLHGFREAMKDTDRFEEGDEYGAVATTATASFPVGTFSGSLTGTGAAMLRIPGDGGSSPTTLSIVVDPSDTLVASLLVRRLGGWTELESDTAVGGGASWTVADFGDTYTEAFVVVTNVADRDSDDYVVTVEAPGWGGGSGGCDTSPAGGASWAWALAPLLLLGLRFRRR